MIDALQLQETLAEVIKLSEKVGQFIANESVPPQEIELKGLNNLVSYVDKEAERMFVEGLGILLPEAGFVAEEGTIDYDDRELRWIIDPLDGTTNYLHSIPCWCTSVGLFDGSTPLLGVIHSPMTNETFSASVGMGAFLNNERIHVSDTAALSSSLLATGFPYDDFGKQNNYMELLKALMPLSRGIRRLGSAAMDLAYVACGRFDGFYEYGLNPWDVAAGIIIVQEAGGTVTDFSSGLKALEAEEILASNTKIHSELITIINQHF